MTDSGSPTALLVGAHPDDIELLAGGTAALLARRGWRVAGVVLTDGARGSYSRTDGLVAQRRAETEEALSLLGVKASFLDGPDAALDPNDKRIMDLLVEAIHSLRPDAVMTHPANDSHPDHQAAAALVERAIFQAKIPDGQGSRHRVAHRFAFSPALGASGNWRWSPDFVVNVSETWRIKLAAIHCHRSQHEWLRRYARFATLEAKRLGMLVGVRRAEGFSAFVPPVLSELPVVSPPGRTRS